MKLDDLRSILLSERETGRLTATDPDIFERGHEELASLMAKVYELVGVAVQLPLSAAV